MTANPSPTAKVALTRLQAAISALGLVVVGAAVPQLAARQDPGRCVDAVEVFYSNERTTASLDTVLYVPPLGALRDSLLRADSAPNGAIFRDVDSMYVSKPVRLCITDSTVHARPVLKT
jgi:hypothetical protein